MVYFWIKTLRLQTLLADIKIFHVSYMGEFFSLQTLSSIILTALCLQNCAQKNNYHIMRKLSDLGNSE